MFKRFRFLKRTKMGTITACCGIVCKRTKRRNNVSLVRDLNRANEYAAKAETKIGMNVAGIDTIKELSIALLSGSVVAPTHASTKFLKVRVKG